MDKVILTLYPKPKKGVDVVALLEEGQKESVPLIRKALAKLDLSNKLILSTHAKISGLFKEDYKFNDHGIYFPYNDSVVVFAEPSTSKRDYERFINYQTFIDKVPEYSVNEMSFSSIGNEWILDIETTGLSIDKDSITLIGLKPIGSKECFIIQNPCQQTIKELLHWATGKTIIGHNLLFDFSFLMKWSNTGIFPDVKIMDTMLLAHVAGERSLSLKHLSMMYGDFLGRRNSLTADNDYLVEDLLSTECLYEKFKSFYNTFSGKLICEATKAFTEVKLAGVKIDEKRLFEIRDEYKYLEQPKYDFNVDSNRELADYLVSKGVKLITKTANGDWSVDKKELSKLPSNPALTEYLEYRQNLTLYQMFILPYCQLESFTIRPDIKLFGTETGRLSCSNPNVQQIPNKSNFKDIFTSRFENGYIGTIDLDRAELGVAALLSGDADYTTALTSQDFHTLVASKTFQKEKVTKQERFVAKSVNFGGVLYGGSAKGIASRINVDSQIVADIQEWYKQAFPILTKWINNQKVSAVNFGRVITYLGRVRDLKGLRTDQQERIGVNTAVQSVASDIMLYIVVRLATLIRQNKLHSKIMFPVHDELLLDIHPLEVEDVVNLIKIAFKDILKTPIGKLELSKVLPISGTLEIGTSWLYLKNENFFSTQEFYISSLG